MSVDDRGGRPLAPHERRTLDDLERGLDDEPGLRAALRHGVEPEPTPRRALLALGLGAGCALVTTTALLLGPGCATGIAVAGVLLLLGVLLRTAHPA